MEGRKREGRREKGKEKVRMNGKKKEETEGRVCNERWVDKGRMDGRSKKGRKA